MGLDSAPVDDQILKQLQSHKIEGDYARKCIEANKKNQVTATYNLLLKKHIKAGGHSVADARKSSYDPAVFKQVKPAPTEEIRSAVEDDAAMLISQRKIADSLGEMQRYEERKKDQVQRQKRRATSQYTAQAQVALTNAPMMEKKPRHMLIAEEEPASFASQLLNLTVPISQQQRD